MENYTDLTSTVLLYRSFGIGVTPICYSAWSITTWSMVTWPSAAAAAAAAARITSVLVACRPEKRLWRSEWL